MSSSPRQALLHRAKRDIPLLGLVTGIVVLVISQLRTFEHAAQPGQMEEMQRTDLLAFLLALIPAIFSLFLWRRWRDLKAELAYRSDVERQISGLALYDRQTNLSSRRLLVEHIEQALKNARRYHFGLGVFVVEIGGFEEMKAVNGADDAARLISAVGDQLTAELRDADIVARLDDEHLAVLLPMVDGVEGAVIAAGRARAALTRLFDLGRTKVPVRIHIGLAYFPGAGEDASELLEHAVSAARLAHYADADQVCYSPPQPQEPRTAAELPADPHLSRN